MLAYDIVWCIAGGGGGEGRGGMVQHILFLVLHVFDCFDWCTKTLKN